MNLLRAPVDMEGKNMLAKNTTVQKDARQHRLEMGAWLKSLREARGLSQRDLANALSLDYYTFISQLENGRGKIPAGRYLDWAAALGQEPRAFVKVLFSHYDPNTYEILFGDED